MAIRLRNVNGTIVALAADESHHKDHDMYLNDDQVDALEAKFALDWGVKAEDSKYSDRWDIMESQTKEEVPEQEVFKWSESNVDVSKHAVERLDERAYIKYFRTFRAGETKEKWLLKNAIKALTRGTRCTSYNASESTFQWYKGLMYVFVNKGEKLILVTVYEKTNPKPHRKRIIPKGVMTEKVINEIYSENFT